MTTPIERLSGLVVGEVESVSPDQIRVQLELEAPHATALNTGTPTVFPRLNGYVLIPNEAGATVAYISWIGIERSPYPKRSGLRDFGLIDLPFPLRKMTVSAVGTLTARRDKRSATTKYELSRGVMDFPSVGDQVLLPTPEQIEAIVGAKESDRRVRIGASPLASNAAIMVDPDKLFGRHLAVLGNTGSGKSCTVAGLIRWSMEAAKNAIKDAAKQGVPNARFIVLDPNGEGIRRPTGETEAISSPAGRSWRAPARCPRLVVEWPRVDRGSSRTARRTAPVAYARSARVKERANRERTTRGDDSQVPRVLLDPRVRDAKPWNYRFCRNPPV
jgi:hypothetical protein